MKDQTPTIEIAADGLGNLLRIVLTPDQQHKMSQAKALIADFPPDVLIADTAYDSDGFRARGAALSS